jgi:hypothetical protein
VLSSEQVFLLILSVLLVVSLVDVFDTPVIGRPFVSSGNIVENQRIVHFPVTTKVHAGLVQKMVERGQSIVVVTPSDRPDFLHLLALEALFGPRVEERDAVFLLSPNTEYRERFRELAPSSIRPPHDKSRYAREETPIANVTTDGSLAKVTKNLKHPDKPAKFLFSYSSTRVPSDEVAERVRCVLYDDSVKFEEDRLLRLLRWKNRNDVPSIIYFTSNPAGDVVEKLGDKVFVWAWPRRFLNRCVSEDEPNVGGWTEGERELAETTKHAARVVRRERNRARGVPFEVRACGGGDLQELLERANRRRARYDYHTRQENAEVLYRGKTLVGYALGGFRELLTPLDLADFHARRTSLSGRINGMERFARQIASDPEVSSSVGTFRDVVSTISELEEAWDDAPIEHKKEGVLVDQILYEVLDDGDSVTVVTATEGHRQALNTYLQSEHSVLYRDLGDDLRVHDTHSVRSADPTDRVVIYGALRWRDRDLLRTDVASEGTVLAYPIELGLLQSQVDAINGAFRDIGERQFWGVIDRLSKKATGSGAEVEKVQINVPDYDELSEEDLKPEVSVDRGENEDLGKIIRGHETDYESKGEFDPSEYDTDTTTQTSAGDGSGRTERDCVQLGFVDGKTLCLRRGTEVHTLREGHDKLLKKGVSRVKQGDVVVHLEDTDGLRSRLYDLIRERGDVGLYYNANMWKLGLEGALKETGDDVDDFAEKMREQGVERGRGTYERWYNMEIHRTRSKRDFWAIAEAYDLDGVKDNFDGVWNAVQEMETIYTRLKKAVRGTALRSAARGTLNDVMLSESPDIRLSDFDIGEYLYRLEVTSKEEGVEVSSSKIGWLSDGP